MNNRTKKKQALHSLSPPLNVRRNDSSSSTSHYLALARSFSQVCALILIFLGTVVLLGWYLNNPFLTSIYPTYPSMKTNSAIGFILIGLTLIVITQPINKVTRFIHYVLSLLVFLIGILTFFEYLFQTDLGIDQLLFREEIGAIGTAYPNRMTLNSSILLALLGFGLLALHRRVFGKWIGQGAVLLGCVILLPTLIGYLYGVDFIYGLATNTKLALPTAIAFSFAITGILLSYADKGFMRVVVSESTGGFLSRRIIFITIALPLTLGWLTLIGSRIGLYDQEFRFLLQISLWIILFTIVIWRNARTLDLIDHERKQSQRNVQFLAEASKVLSSSLEYPLILQNVAQLSVSYICDWCNVDMVNEKGALEIITMAHRDEKKARWGKKMRQSVVQRKVKKLGSTQVLLSGKAERYSYVTDEILKEVSQNETHYQTLRSLGISSFMVVPILIGKKVVGVISFLSTDPRKHYTATDLSVVEDLARRASLAIHNSQLYKSSQNAIKLRDEFISVASHELKTPLTSLKVYIQVLEKQLEGVSKEKSLYLSKMDAQVEKLNKLIGDLLDVSRTRIGKLQYAQELFDVSALISEVVDAIQPTVPTHTILFKTNKSYMLTGDRDRIGQVIINLLTNAIRYSPNAHEVLIQILQKKHTIEIVVKDFGVGIEKKHISRIFDRFYQVNSQGGRTHPGLGIGLFISKEIVEKHNGKIWVESAKGKGSTFHVAFPIR